MGRDVREVLRAALADAKGGKTEDESIDASNTTAGRISAEDRSFQSPGAEAAERVGVILLCVITNRILVHRMISSPSAVEDPIAADSDDEDGRDVRKLICFPDSDDDETSVMTRLAYLPADGDINLPAEEFDFPCISKGPAL